MDEHKVTNRKSFQLAYKDDPHRHYSIELEESDQSSGYNFRLVVFGEAGPWEHFEKAPYIFNGHMALSPYFTESGKWEAYRIEKAK